MIRKSILLLLIIFIYSSCQSPKQYEINIDILSALGAKHRIEYESLAKNLKLDIIEDSSNVDALLSFSETQIILYIFGFISREETMPLAKSTLAQAQKFDSTSTMYYTISGMISLLDWEWINSKQLFEKAIEVDSTNLNARHWLSLYFSAMGDFDSAMEQSDIIATMDPDGNYQIGRGSLLYFARRNEEMKDLMLQTVASQLDVAWGYDWLGMAYCELKDFDNSIETYFKAFNLSDGTVEVGAGLGHALGLGGEYSLAKQMADYYTLSAKNHYLPPVQRSFIHIGIGEYDEAIALLNQAYDEQSWFLVFMQIEPWYDPIRNDARFQSIIDRMEFQVN